MRGRGSLGRREEKTHKWQRKEGRGLAGNEERKRTMLRGKVEKGEGDGEEDMVRRKKYGREEKRINNRVRSQEVSWK